MKVLAYIISIVLLIPAISNAQSKITTMILVRHAEKENDGTNNPGLSEKGQSRAMHLAKILSRTDLDAIYSTNYKRTLDTVTPIAKEKNLEIKLYEPFNDQSVEKMLSESTGKTLLIVGHSNNIPRIANRLTREEFGDWKDEEYSNLLIVSQVSDDGPTKVTWLTFGAVGD